MGLRCKRQSTDTQTESKDEDQRIKMRQRKREREMLCMDSWEGNRKGRRSEGKKNSHLNDPFHVLTAVLLLSFLEEPASHSRRVPPFVITHCDYRNEMQSLFPPSFHMQLQLL